MDRHAMIAAALAAALPFLQSQPQDSKPASRAADEARDPARDAVVGALTKLYERPGQDFDGSVKTDHREADAAAGGVMVLMPGANLAKPFEGSVEIRRSEEETAIVGGAEDNGFAVLANKRNRVVRLTYEHEPPAVQECIPEILALTDRDEWLRAARKATWKSKGNEGDRAVYTARLGKRMLPPPPPPTLDAPFHPGKKVVRLEARVELDKVGEIARIQIAVVKFDPIASMMDSAREQAMGGSGSVAIGPDEFMRDPDEDEDGTVTTYVLEPRKTPASARLGEAQRALRPLLAKKK